MSEQLVKAQLKQMIAAHIGFSLLGFGLLAVMLVHNIG